MNDVRFRPRLSWLGMIGFGVSNLVIGIYSDLPIVSVLGGLMLVSLAADISWAYAGFLERSNNQLAAAHLRLGVLFLGVAVLDLVTYLWSEQFHSTDLTRIFIFVVGAINALAVVRAIQVIGVIRALWSEHGAPLDLPPE